MPKRVTIKDIAELAGVSLGTVHCALAGKAGVGEATRKRILEIAQKSDYRPNALAASLKRKTVSIAAAFPEPVEENRFYFPEVWRGVQEYLGSVRDYNVRLVELPYQKGQGRKGDEIEDLYGRGMLDGLLTVGFMDDFGQASLAKFNHSKIPMILVGDDVPQSGRLCCVQPNYHVVGKILAELLSRQIPKDGSILLCAGNATMPSHYLVVAGFDAYLQEHGLENTVYKIHTESLGENGMKRVARELERHDDIVACASVNARGSVVLGQALVETKRAGTVPAVGSDLFEENVAFLRDGVFSNVMNKNPFQQSFFAAKALVDYLLRDIVPSEDVLFVNSEVVFQSSLDMHDATGMVSLPLTNRR